MEKKGKNLKKIERIKSNVTFNDQHCANGRYNYNFIDSYVVFDYQ